MSVAVCSGVLVVISMLAMAQAYFPVRQPNYFGGPLYDTSCRESIEDLKALVEVTQTMKQDNNNYSCSTCATTFSEEIIMKLINALIYTATHNCGYNNGNGGYYSGGSTNVGGGNAGGGLIGGDNTGVGTSSNNLGGLINVGVLNGKDTASLGLGGTKLLGVDVGPQSGSNGGEYQGGSTTATGGNGGDGLIQLGVLDKGNSLANLGLGGSTLLNVALGKDNEGNSGAGGAYPTNSGSTVPTTTPVSSSSGDGLIQLGVLDKGNSLANLGLGGSTLLNVALGKDNEGNSGTGVTYPTNSGTTVPTSTPVSSSPVTSTGTAPVSGSPAIPTSSVPVNGPEGITSPVSSLPVAEGGSILPSNSDNLGGVTNPTNAGDVNQVNQQINKVTNIIPSN